MAQTMIYLGDWLPHVPLKRAYILQLLRIVFKLIACVAEISFTDFLVVVVVGII